MDDHHAHPLQHPVSSDNSWAADTSAWPDSDVKRMADELAEMGLVKHIAELELFGYTVVHADKVNARPLAEKALARICDISEQRLGLRPDLVGGTTHVGVHTRTIGKIIHEDRVFQQLLMHPIALALVTYTLGRSCVFSGSAVFMKGPATTHDVTANDSATAKILAERNALSAKAKANRLQLGLHVDYVDRPAPFPALHEMCNVTWLLSDYDEEKGSIAFVPGSHRVCRHPMDLEGEEDAVPITAPMGSIVVFNSAIWHGSFPRKIPGLRTGLALWYCRPFVARLESFADVITPELMEGMPERFATLMGLHRLEYGLKGAKDGKFVLRPGHLT
jgi:ectoine hydroxylase-related dioxygenase (phytanoyl-CoA dioxygenase family)